MKKAPHHIPANVRDKKFCDGWLAHYDHNRAYVEAGFSAKSRRRYHLAKAKLKRFMPFLRPFQEAKAQQVGKQLAIKDGDVLETMKAVAYANILDYYERSDEPLMREVHDKDGNVKLEPVMFQGRPVFKMEPKPLYELTREQTMGVEPVYAFGRLVGYQTASLKVRHQYLESLGKNLGLWLEDLVKRRENERHKHVHLHLEAVPTEKIVEIEQLLIGVVGPEFARSLGISSEEIAAAIKGELSPVVETFDQSTAPIVGS
jgi:hypothetical protein